MLLAEDVRNKELQERMKECSLMISLKRLNIAKHW